MKTALFQSCGHCWVFQICWHIECSTFRASSFRIWNSSTGIPSPPLALFVVMLPKAHLTSHSRMTGSRWVITPSWLSGSWRSFLYSSVYSCHLFLICSASLRSLPFLSFIKHIGHLENPMNSMKRQKDRTLKDELPRSVGAQYATGYPWRNNSRKNEGIEPKQLLLYCVIIGTLQCFFI